MKTRAKKHGKGKKQQQWFYIAVAIICYFYNFIPVNKKVPYLVEPCNVSGRFLQLNRVKLKVVCPGSASCTIQKENGIILQY